MKNLLLSSFLLILLSACGISNYRGLHKSDVSTTLIKPVFADTTSTYLFNTSIDFLTKHFSGLLLVKPMATKDAHYRVVFTSEIGITFFDFEYQDTTFTVHSCFDAINKPSIINTLRDDIALLLMRELSLKRPEVLTDKGFEVYKFKGDEENHFYFIEKTHQQIQKIVSATKIFKKGTATFANYKQDVPYSIVIRHHNFPLTMSFNLLGIKANKATPKKKKNNVIKPFFYHK